MISRLIAVLICTLLGGGEVMAGFKSSNGKELLMTYSHSKMKSSVETELYKDMSLIVKMHGAQGDLNKTIKIEQKDFKELLALLDSKDFKNLQDSYAEQGWDDGFTIRVTYKGKNITVENHETPGPLKKITDKLDQIVSRVK